MPDVPGYRPRTVISHMTGDGIVVVGGGLAGAGAALELRRLGFAGRLTLIGAEAHLPYSRPPLSKGYLRGEEPFEDALVAPRQDYGRHDIDLLLGTAVARIDAGRLRIRLEDGGELPYQQLLVATGGRKRRLPFAGSDLDGVYDLRTVDDCERIRTDAQPGRHAVVIGLGFIGCEVAASLRMLGLDVTALDPGPVPLARVLGTEVGAAIAHLHRSRGVKLLLEEGVERLEGSSSVARVVTKSGRRIDCDLVVAGIGIEPNVDLLKAAGAAVSDGVEVDEHCRTSLPHIFAAGDIANHLHPVFGRVRVEHWNNADRQGKAAAAAMLGRGPAYDYVHTFWSDQFDQKLEYVGYARRWDEIEVDGSLASLDFIARYRSGGRLLSAAAIGRGGDPEAEAEGELKKIATEIRAAAPLRAASDDTGD
jgi:3-phenylpropionate/trans-cinnamate dioxygenase ferredoxin reductase component